jgi:hypothetical protein
VLVLRCCSHSQIHCSQLLSNCFGVGDQYVIQQFSTILKGIS